MKHRNLKDPVIAPTTRYVRDLQGASPIGFSSVTRGGLRIASQEGLTVEGSILGVANNELGLPAHIDWRGTAVFQNGLSVGPLWNNPSGALIVGESSDPRLAHINGPLTARGHVFFPGDLTEEQATFIVGEDGMSESDMPVWLHGIAEESSAAGMRALAINSYNEVISVPFPTSGGGGDPGGGGDNAKGLIYPFPLSEAGDRWGPRNYAPSPFHRGIDWPKPAGTGIPCSGDGTVIMAENTGDLWGNYIRVDHGDGIWTAYAHMQPGGIYVSVGQSVTRGQIIGGVGTTGPSTGNHLHFEVWIGGERVDPEGYIGPE